MDNINVDELLKKILEEADFANCKTPDFEEFLPEFVSKALENLDLIDENIKLLEDNIGNEQAILDIFNEMFRYYHNIKGSSSLVGQYTIQKIAHQTETLMVSCNESVVPTDKETISLIKTSTRLIRKICNDISLNANDEFTNGIFNHLKEIDDVIYQDGCEDEVIVKDKEYLTYKINCELLLEFKPEIEEDLKVIEQKTEQLSKNPDKKILNSVYRAVHTINGIAGYSGQMLIKRISYELEVLLEACRRDEIAINDKIIALIYNSVSFIRGICDDFSLIKDESFLNKILNHLESMKVSNFKKEFTIDNEFWQDFISETKEHIEAIEANVQHIERDATNLKVINAIFRAFHTIKGLAGFVNQNLIQEIAHKTETVLDGCMKGAIKINNTLIDVILSSTDCIRQICSDISLNRNQSFLNMINEHLKLLEDIQASADEMQPNNNETEKKLEVQRDNYNKLMKENLNFKEESDSINVNENSKERYSFDAVRIPKNKIEKLSENIDEIIKIQACIDKEAFQCSSSGVLYNNIKALTRKLKILKDIAITIKTVSLESAFQKIKRIAEDTMFELKKEIYFSLSGEDIEIDRQVADKILDPLVHIVRNAVAHGIENSEVRKNLGKSPTGNIKVSAYSKNGKIIINVADDGKGLDTDKIYKKAVQKNLVTTDRNYSENEIIEFIFNPGFTTAESVDSVSGRGVGMDVVKTEIQKMNGEISIKSKLNEGSTFTMIIPTDNAVINGAVTDIQGTIYIIPLVNIKQVLNPTDDNWSKELNRYPQFVLNDEIIPTVYISDFLGTENYESENEIVILLEFNGEIKALPAKKIIENKKVLVKPQEEDFIKLDFVAGISILEDDEPCLVLDVENLFNT